VGSVEVLVRGFSLGISECWMVVELMSIYCGGSFGGTNVMSLVFSLFCCCA